MIVNLGDFADMPSLSNYDRGKLNFEGRRVMKDIHATHSAMTKLLAPMNYFNERRRINKKAVYSPEMHLTLGNHEHRIVRAIQEDSKLDGLLGIPDLQYERYGWNVHEFLKPVEIDGVFYAHYFYNPLSGRNYGGMVETRLKNLGFSFTQGHEQTKRIGSIERNNGDMHRGVICGACYLHDEDYKGPQANGHWRGIIVKHEVRGGNYDLMEVSMDYLCRKYEGVHVWEFMREKYPELHKNSYWLQREEYRASLRAAA